MRRALGYITQWKQQLAMFHDSGGRCSHWCSWHPKVQWRWLPMEGCNPEDIEIFKPNRYVGIYINFFQL